MNKDTISTAIRLLNSLSQQTQPIEGDALQAFVFSAKVLLKEINRLQNIVLAVDEELIGSYIEPLSDEAAFQETKLQLHKLQSFNISVGEYFATQQQNDYVGGFEPPWEPMEDI